MLQMPLFSCINEKEYVFKVNLNDGFINIGNSKSISALVVQWLRYFLAKEVTRVQFSAGACRIFRNINKEKLGVR